MFSANGCLPLRFWIRKGQCRKIEAMAALSASPLRYTPDGGAAQAGWSFGLPEKSSPLMGKSPNSPTEPCRNGKISCQTHFYLNPNLLFTRH